MLNGNLLALQPIYALINPLKVAPVLYVSEQPCIEYLKAIIEFTERR